jgi:hypothetical protein
MDGLNEIVNYYNRHLPNLILLLGIKELCKNKNCDRLSELVNRHEIKLEVFRDIIFDLSKDDSFDSLIEGELYDILLDVQMMANDLKKYQKGSLLDYLNSDEDEES